jgi:tetratricopeptide (TPR) repeat protein
MIHPSSSTTAEPRRAHRLAVVVALVVLATPAGAGRAAAADPPPDGAVPPDDPENARLFERALLHYDTHEYDQAIDLFRQLYERTRSPALLFNLGQAYRLKGDCPKAVDLYREFIRRDPSSPDLARAKAKLAELEPCKPTPPAQGESPGAVPAPPAAVPAPPLAVTAPSAPPARPALVADSPAPAKAEPAFAGRGASARGGGAVLGGVGLGLAAAAGYYAWRSSQAADEISGLFSREGVVPWDAHAAEVDARGRSAEDTATTLLVLASVSVVLGVAAYIYGWKADRRASP